jgi:hypothetical protein
MPCLVQSSLNVTGLSPALSNPTQHAQRAVRHRMGSGSGYARQMPCAAGTPSFWALGVWDAVCQGGHNDGRRRPLPNYTARNRDQQRMPGPPFFVFLGTGGRTGHTMLGASTSGTRAAHMRPATWTSSPLARGGLKSCDPAPAVPAWAGRRAEAAVGASNLAYDEALYRGKTGAARQKALISRWVRLIPRGRCRVDLPRSSRDDSSLDDSS